MHGETIWKSGMDEIAKAFMDIALDPTWGGGGAYSTPYDPPPPPPSCKGHHVDKLEVMAYSHKTQSFMKNGGQQKCLDKALSGKEIVGCYNLY